MQTTAGESVVDIGATAKSAEADATTLERVVLDAAMLDEGDALGENAGEAAVPNRILIVPWGEVRSASGTFIADEQAMRAAISEFEAHGTDLPIDYEHQTLGGSYSSPTGQAPAAGWIRSLAIVRPGNADADEPGLWAEVSWTSEASEKLASRQYRYLSPVALVRRVDRRLVGVHSVALTNKPAIVGMRPVVNRDEAPVTAEPQVSMVHDSLDSDVTLTALRETLSLDVAAGSEAVLEVALGRIRTLESTCAQRAASDRVAGALSSGKLTGSQRDWAFALAMRAPDEFDRWEESAPRVVALGRLAPPSSPDGRLQQKAVEAAARSEWQANRQFLEQLCTEDAYAITAARDCAEN